MAIPIKTEPVAAFGESLREQAEKLKTAKKTAKNTIIGFLIFSPHKARTPEFIIKHFRKNLNRSYTATAPVALLFMVVCLVHCRKY